MAAQYVAETTVLYWHERLLCSKCDSRDIYSGNQDRAAVETGAIPVDSKSSGQ